MSGGYYGFTHGGVQYSAAENIQKSASTSYVTVKNFSYGNFVPAQGDSYEPASYTYATTSNEGATVVALPAVQVSKPSYSSNGLSGKAATPQSTTAPNYPSSSYDAALYSAASTIAQQLQQIRTSTITTKSNQRWSGFRKPVWQQGVGVSGYQPNKPRAPPKPEQLLYCEICRVSCAGPQSFQDHIKGQKHKKREVASKNESDTKTVVKPPPNAYKCELCDTICTGADAFAAHVRGVKHQKVVKLHKRMGKPIPEPPINDKEGVPKIIVGMPKINFVGGALLSTLSKSGESENLEVKIEDIKQEATAKPKEIPKDPTSDIKPIGQEYLEEVKNEQGKVVSFKCKLCDCNFTDLFAKDMHMKGRRHRLNYKKKVDPNLYVEIKLSPRLRKLEQAKQKRINFKEELQRRREVAIKVKIEEQQHFMEMQMLSRGPPGNNEPLMTNEDCLIASKHSLIYPRNEELQAVQKIIINTEKALKMVSDELFKSSPEDAEKDEAAAKTQKQRILTGVMRVGLLAKGLLLKGDLNAELVVLSSEKPTRVLLEQVADTLPKFLGSATEKYEILKDITRSSFIVKSQSDLKASVRITITSPTIKNDTADPPDMLDKEYCLIALAEVRRAKWFQVCAASLEPSVMIMRIFRDITQRVPCWSSLNEWALELLIEKVIRSTNQPVSLMGGLRRVLEAVAGGILLPGGPGLMDPCEKNPTDAATSMTDQEREGLTASAQHAMRLVAFKQLHKVLGMDLPHTQKATDSTVVKRELEGAAESNSKRDKK